ncbi:MAG: hypothetical protein OQJ81_05940 [Melioribacteraceae bacterium]|nr:hypothetical protein [Melioribacteraceae bacterium]
MLDRILNINPQEKYKSGLKVPSNHNYAVNRYDQDKQHSKDSALFSPLAKLMSKINWRILNIEYPSSEEMLLNFMVDDLEFITVINFNEMYNKSYQEFSIYRAVPSHNRRKYLEVKLNVEKYVISVLETPNQIKTEKLSVLFNRVSEINFDASLKIVEKEALKQIKEGIALEINSELNYILKVIYTFISTKSKSKIKNNFILKTNKNIPIIMQKVAIIHAE